MGSRVGSLHGWGVDAQHEAGEVSQRITKGRSVRLGRGLMIVTLKTAGGVEQRHALAATENAARSTVLKVSQLETHLKRQNTHTFDTRKMRRWEPIEG